jgi:hypothetical protein
MKRCRVWPGPATPTHRRAPEPRSHVRHLFRLTKLPSGLTRTPLFCFGLGFVLAWGCDDVSCVVFGRAVAPARVKKKNLERGCLLGTRCSREELSNIRSVHSDGGSRLEQLLQPKGAPNAGGRVG